MIHHVNPLRAEPWASRGTHEPPADLVALKVAFTATSRRAADLADRAPLDPSGRIAREADEAAKDAAALWAMIQRRAR